MRDEAGFTAFVLARGPALKRLAWLLTTDAVAAEDLVQEALARIVPRWDRIEPGARESYVRMSLRSIWIDGWRRRGGRQIDLVPEPPERGGDDRALEGTATRLALDEALSRLTPRQRTVLVLRFYEDLTEVQTADAMGCTTSTVKSQTRHALERLRRLAPDLADRFEPPEPEAGTAPRSAPPASSPGTAAPARTAPRRPVTLSVAPVRPRRGEGTSPSLSVSGPVTGELAVDVTHPPPGRPTPGNRMIVRLAAPDTGEEVPDEPA